LIRLHSLTQK